MVLEKSSFGRSCHGFTLTELLITLVVAAILVMLVIPSYRNLVADTKFTTDTNELVTSLQYARSAAITRVVPVSICASSNGASCTSTDWKYGWIVFTDNGTAGVVDGDDTILRVKQRLEAGLTLDFSNNSYIRFMPNGGLSAYCERCDIDGNTRKSTSVARTSRTVSILLAVLGINDTMARSIPRRNARNNRRRNNRHPNNCRQQQHGNQHSRHLRNHPNRQCRNSSNTSNNNGPTPTTGSNTGNTGNNDASAGSNPGSSGNDNSTPGTSGSSNPSTDTGGTSSQRESVPPSTDNNASTTSNSSQSSSNTNTGNNSSNSTSQNTFTLCDSTLSGETGRSIEILTTGRIRISKIQCD